MTPYEDVIVSYSDLEDGVVLSGQDCPQCLGGQDKERSMSVGMSNGLLWWRCHRSSCGFKGGWRGTASVGGESHQQRRTARQFTSSPLPDDVKLMLAERLNVPAETFAENGWSYTSSYGNYGRRVVIPIRSPDGSRRGFVLRSYWGDTPKAVNELLPDSGESIAWCRASRFGKMCAVVEDIPSAHRLMCSGVDAVALLGTTINYDRALEITRAGFTKAILCLDNDATDRALRQVVALPQLRSLFNVKPLDDVDIKDMSPETFDTFIKEIKSMTS